MSSDETTAAAIYQRFQGLIATGYLGRGERLPTVRQTAADLGVALGTAARAYKQLEAEGLVVSRTGAGTRVADAASPLDRAVVLRIRELVAEAHVQNLELDQVVSALRAIWRVED